MSIRKFVLSTVLALIGGVILTIVHGYGVSAAVNNAPDPDFYTPNGSDVLLVASKSGTNSGGSYNALESPVIVVMAYFDNPTGNSIIIWNGASPCGIPGDGSGVDGTVEGPTAFTVLDVAAGTYTGIYGSNSMSCGNYTINLPTLQPYTIPGSGGQVRYVAKVTATNNTVGTINAFRVSIPAGKGVMSFYDQSSRQFAIQDRANWGSSPGNETQFDLPFAPSCTVSSNTVVKLLWKDDDWGASNQGPNMRMQLLEDGAVVATKPTSDFTGPNADGEWAITVKPGKKYIWRWKGVSERNGIQFQLPFDSFYYSFDCHPITVVLDASGACNGVLKFRVSDPTNTKYDARLRWDGVDTSSLLQNLTPGNNPGQNVYEFDISNRKDFEQHIASLRIVSDSGKVVQDKPVVGIPECAKAWCSADPTLTPANPTPGQPFTLTSSISTDIGPLGKATLYSAQVATQGTATITYQSAGPGNVSVPSPATVVGPNSGSNTAGPTSGGGIGPGSAAGGNNETVSWTMIYPTAGDYSGWVAYNGGFSLVCQFGNGNKISVSDKPYLRIWGGDVAVGCANDSNVWKTGGLAGEVRAYSLRSGKGAGTNLSIQARRLIDGFSSAQRASIPIDDYLTFANTGTGGVDPTWGGDFGGQLCPSNFYGSAPSTMTSFYASLPASSVVRSYSSGGMLSTSSRVIQPGQDVTLYVNGDVTLTGTGLRYNTGGWTDLSKIPSFKLIVSGDIKIANTVSELSGLYVAQPRPDGSGGNIITCVDGNGNKYNSSALVGSCSSTLNIYGAFVAKNIKFLRLSGSIATASSGDAPGTGSAAEKFVYSPEMWLNSKLNTSVGSYDSVTSMPPVF